MKQGIPVITDASRYAPIGQEYRDDNIEIKIWNYPDDTASIDLKFKNNWILHYDTDLQAKNFYKPTDEFEEFYRVPVTKALLLSVYDN